MKKALPIVIGAVIIVIGGFSVLKLGKSDKDQAPSVAEESSSPESFTGKLKDAIKLGTAMKCTYEVEGNKYESYIKGENYRGKIQTIDGKSGQVIMKDDCMWTWNEGEPQGIKTCYEPVDVEVEAETGDVWSQPQGAAGPDITYTCRPTTVSDATFTPPSDIEFMDLDAMMESFGY